MSKTIASHKCKNKCKSECVQTRRRRRRPRGTGGGNQLSTATPTASSSASATASSNISLTDAVINAQTTAYRKAHQSLTNNDCNCIQNNYNGLPLNNNINLGQLFAKSLLNNGINHFFGVPSDLNMALLNAMLEEKDIIFIGNRNELNASYMAEGYARTKPFSCMCIGSMVGSLSASNGFANAFTEKNPILMIAGSNNSNDILDGKLSHHTLYEGREDQYKSYEVYSTLVGQQNTSLINTISSPGILNVINNISYSLTNFNSAYVHIPVNNQQLLGNIDYSNIISNDFQNISFTLEHYKFYNIVSNWLQTNFNNDINEVRKLNPVFLFGSAYNQYSKYITLADDNFYELMDSMGAVMFFTIDAKGILEENRSNVLGYYWGGATEQFKLDIFQNSNLLVYIGVELSDYTSSGYTCLFSPHYSINCRNISILNIQSGKMNDLKLDDTSIIVSSSISEVLNDNTDLFVETGSSWFYGARTKMPKGCRFNISIKYGSIGWCFPASIGNAFANPTRKTICLTGDGAFQCVLQETMTAVTYDVNLTLILIDNQEYQIENVIDNESYNHLPPIDYELMAKSMYCKSVITCDINNFNSVLKKYNSLLGFNMIILKNPKTEIDNLMSNWGKLVSAYNSHQE